MARDGYFDGGGIAALAREHLRQEADHGQRLWLLCTAEIWYRLFIEQQDLAAVQHDLVRSAPRATA